MSLHPQPHAISLAAVQQVDSGARVVVKAILAYLAPAKSLQGRDYTNVIMSDGDCARVGKVFESVKMDLIGPQLRIGYWYQFGITVTQRTYDTSIFVNAIRELPDLPTIPSIGSYPQGKHHSNIVVSESLTIKSVLDQPTNVLFKKVLLTSETSEKARYISLWRDSLPPSQWENLAQYQGYRVRLDRVGATCRAGNKAVSLQVLRNLSRIQIQDA